jgi:hypothetical protein
LEIQKKKKERAGEEFENDRHSLLNLQSDLSGLRSRLTSLFIKWNLEPIPEPNLPPLPDQPEEDEEEEIESPENSPEDSPTSVPEEEPERASEGGSLFSGMDSVSEQHSGQPAIGSPKEEEGVKEAETETEEGQEEAEQETEETPNPAETAETAETTETPNNKEAQIEEAKERLSTKQAELESTMVKIQELDEQMLALVENPDLGEEELERCGT